MAKPVPGRLSSVASMELVRVENEDGDKLGRVFDIRTQYDPGRAGQPPIVAEITYGTTGFLERLGVRRIRPRAAEWKSIVEIRPDAIVIKRKR